MHPRDTHRLFRFEGWEFEAGSLTFRTRCRMDRHEFVEAFRFDPRLVEGRELPGAEVIDRLGASLLLMSGINSYKAACPPEVETPPLGPDQAAFWSLLYRHGLGEYLYVNRLPPERVAIFPVTGRDPEPIMVPTGDRCLVLMGGGKDSLVSARALSRAGVPFDLLTLGRHALAEEIAPLLGARLLRIDRELSPEMFALNAAGYYNGHVPFSAHLAFLSTIAAVLGGYRWIVVSNERSAGEGNVTWRGLAVNHQYSKSLDFERRFQDYSRRFLTPDAGYFSLLRPLDELAIAWLFDRDCGGLGRVFSSCNRNFHLDGQGPRGRWCRKCPKCLFTFVMLGAFSGLDRMTEILGGNPLEDASLAPLIRELAGVEGIKPLECVGTAEEFRLAWVLLARDPRAGTSVLGREMPAAILPARPAVPIVLDRWHRDPGEHAIPPAFLAAWPELHPGAILARGTEVHS